MIAFFKKLFTRKPNLKRMELRFCRYSEADALIKADPAWRVAKEEDENRMLGWVFIERVE